jgi:hydrogenase 3 maturation protease
VPSRTTPRGTQEELKKWLSGAKRVVIAGIGNPMRRDDFVGIKIVEGLREKVGENVLLIECETVPESFIQQIIDFNPTHLMLIDAAIQGLKQGEWKLTDSKKLTTAPAYSTHALPLRVFCEQLLGTAKVRIALLLIEPKETGFGEGLSPEIEAAEENICVILKRALCKRG